MEQTGVVGVRAVPLSQWLMRGALSSAGLGTCKMRDVLERVEHANRPISLVR